MVDGKLIQMDIIHIAHSAAENLVMEKWLKHVIIVVPDWRDKKWDSIQIMVY